MLKTSYTLNLAQLLKIVLEFKRYFWQKLQLKKTQNSSRVTTKKQVSCSILKLGTTVVIIDNHMAIIQV
jgi:hypothetical protein